MSTADIDRELIRDIFIKHGFTIKDGYTDLKPYVYAAADDLIALACFAQPGQATNADVHTLRRLIECAEKLNERPRPLCRDCADENGTCPNSGLECDMRKLFADAKALHNRLAVPASTAATQPDHALTAAVDAAMVEMANISPPLRRSECARLIRAALATPQHSVTEHADWPAGYAAWLRNTSKPPFDNDQRPPADAFKAGAEWAFDRPLASTAATQPSYTDLLQALRNANRLLRAAGFAMTGTCSSKIVAAINAHAAATQPEQASITSSIVRDVCKLDYTGEDWDAEKMLSVTVDDLRVIVDRNVAALAIPASTAPSAPARLSEEHPNLKVPTDPACSAKLDELGDDRGQGLDPYWKFGFRTGWHHGVLTQRASTAASEKVGALDPLTIKSAIAAIAKRLTNDSIGQYAEPAEDGDDAGKRNYDAGKFGGINDLMREVERWLDANIATPAASEQQAGADERERLLAVVTDFTSTYDEVRADEGVYTLTEHDRWLLDTFSIELEEELKAALTHRATTAIPGYKLVPVEATPEMLEAAVPINVVGHPLWRLVYASAYKSLVAAAPDTATTAADQQGDTVACSECGAPKPEIFMGDHMRIAHGKPWGAAQGQASDDARAGVRDAIAEALSNVYYCGRAWSAWGVGTMSEDDFTPAAEVDEVLDGLTDAAIAAMAPAP